MSLEPALIEVLTANPAHTYEQIAAAIGLSTDGVKSRIQRASQVLGAKNRTDVIVRALKAGIIRLDDIVTENEHGFASTPSDIQ